MTVCGAALFAQTEADFGTWIVEDGVVIVKYMGKATDVVIPTAIDGMPVVEIGGYAFESNKSLKTVTIPEGVTSIGDDAFFGLRNLSDEVRSDIEKRFGERVFNSAFYHVSFIKR
jgi:hypothetical protein